MVYDAPRSLSPRGLPVGCDIVRVSDDWKEPTMMDLTDRIAVVLRYGLAESVPVTRAAAVVFAAGLVVDADRWRAANDLAKGEQR